MNDKFSVVMQALDADLLEEAMEPVRRKRSPGWLIAAAACLCILLSLPMLRPGTSPVSLSELRSMGYQMPLPETVEVIGGSVVAGRRISCVVQPESAITTAHWSAKWRTFIVHPPASR